MHEEPRHRLMLTHQQLRVMDVKIRPGDTTLFHVHDVPVLFVAISAAPVDIQLLDNKWGGTHPAADPGRKPGDVNVDTSYVRQSITHRVTNVGSRFSRLGSAIRSRNPYVYSAINDPGFATLHRDPRWARLVTEYRGR